MEAVRRRVEVVAIPERVKESVDGAVLPLHPFRFGIEGAMPRHGRSPRSRHAGRRLRRTPRRIRCRLTERDRLQVSGGFEPHDVLIQLVPR